MIEQQHHSKRSKLQTGLNLVRTAALTAMASDFLLRWQLPVSIGVVMAALLSLLLTQEPPTQPPLAAAPVSTTTPPVAPPAPAPVVGVPVKSPLAVDTDAVSEPVIGAKVAQAEIENLLNRWTTAWQQKDLAAYFAAYAAAYLPPNGSDRAVWQAERTRIITRARDLRISWHDLSWATEPEAEATAEIRLDYQAAGYGDSTRKRLLLRREDGSLRIVSEQNLAVERR